MSGLCSLVGTPKYASLNSHHRRDLSRRDDMLALGYFICSLFHGSLPWQDDCSDSSLHCLKAAEKKGNFHKSIQVKLSPPEFSDYIQYCEQLSFKAQPDYKMLCRLIEKVAARERIDLYDNMFDWNLIKASQALYTQAAKANISTYKQKSYYIPPEIGNCDNLRHDERVAELAKRQQFKNIEEVNLMRSKN